MNLSDVNNIISSELKKLNEINLDDKCFSKEVERGQAIAQLTKSYVRNVSNALQIEKFKYTSSIKDNELPQILRSNN